MTEANRWVEVIGIGADGAAGLSAHVLELVHAADFLVGGERHLNYFPAARSERCVLKDDLAGAIQALAERHPAQRCVVLASGDPLFYGIGRRLLDHLGRDRVRVRPAVSSMQLAFARAGLPWDDAALASVHGRDLRRTLLPLLGKPCIGLFTHDGDSPAAVARFFLQRGLSTYAATVGENLGGPDERVTDWPSLHVLAAERFTPLNYLVLRRTDDASEATRYRELVPGVPDDAFARPSEGPEMMTRQEVRAVTVARLGGPLAAGDTIWDVGAGLGTVAVELAVLRPGVEVIAVERDASRAALLRANRVRFGAYNITVVEGTAPDALAPFPDRPRRVFLGGSGDRLAATLALVADRLADGGRLVANFVTLEHFALTLQTLKAWGWPVEVVEIQVARGDALAGLTGLKPQRSVFIVSADRPGAGRQGTHE